MHPRLRRPFTLIELLVVVAIIGILVAILLPALQKARTSALNSLCVSQIRQISAVLVMYTNDHDTVCPWVRSAANPSTCQTAPFGSGCSGFGAFGLAGYLESGQILYCPDMEVTQGWGKTPWATRLRFKRDFMDYVRSQKDIRVDYNLCWWGGAPRWDQLEEGTGFGRHPIGGGPQVFWIADGHSGFAYYYLREMPHDGGRFMNLGRLDGSVATVRDWRDRQPATGGAGYYYPFNDRPGWGFWRYFGVGHGIE
jgi:prepilin-type N-terminal cleavage/methylation domain-containing protein